MQISQNDRKRKQDPVSAPCRTVKQEAKAKRCTGAGGKRVKTRSGKEALGGGRTRPARKDPAGELNPAIKEGENKYAKKERKAEVKDVLTKNSRVKNRDDDDKEMTRAIAAFNLVGQTEHGRIRKRVFSFARCATT